MTIKRPSLAMSREADNKKFESPENFPKVFWPPEAYPPKINEKAPDKGGFIHIQSPEFRLVKQILPGGNGEPEQGAGRDAHEHDHGDQGPAPEQGPGGVVRHGRFSHHFIHGVGVADHAQIIVDGDGGVQGG